MKKVVGFMKNMRFGFSEVDVDLNGLEFLGAVIIGIVICGFFFLGGV